MSNFAWSENSPRVAGIESDLSIRFNTVVRRLAVTAVENWADTEPMQHGLYGVKEPDSPIPYDKVRAEVWGVPNDSGDPDYEYTVLEILDGPNTMFRVASEEDGFYASGVNGCDLEYTDEELGKRVAHLLDWAEDLERVGQLILKTDAEA